MQKSEETLPLEAPINYFTVVIGTGPIGLLSGLSALRYCDETEKIAIVADRLDELGIRQQVLWIQKDVYDFIKDVVGNELMQRYIESNAIYEDLEEGYYITTGDFEQLCFDALSVQYTMGEHYDLYQSKKITSDEDLTKNLQIDLKGHRIKMAFLACNDQQFPREGQMRTLCFKYLTAADGAKRSVARSIGDDLVLFDETQAPLAHTKHLVATFQIPKQTNPKTCLMLKKKGKSATDLLTPCSLDTLKHQFGWSHPTRPYSQIYSTADVIYIGVEMPDNLPHAAAREYAIALMADTLPKSYIDQISDIPCDLTTSYGQKRQKLSLSAFDISLGDLNRTVLPCGDTADPRETAVIFFLGDNRKNPLYTTGTGVQTGVREVILFDIFLKNQHAQTASLEQNLGIYHAGVRAIIENIMLVQDKWIATRRHTLTTAQENYQVFQVMKTDLARLNHYMSTLQALVDRTKALVLPELLLDLQDHLSHLNNQSIQVLNFIQDESTILSYNQIDIKQLLNELCEIHQKIITKYPHLHSALKESEPAFKDAITKGYNLLKNIAHKAQDEHYLKSTALAIDTNDENLTDSEDNSVKKSKNRG